MLPAQTLDSWETDDDLCAAPAVSGVFLIEFSEGQPYFGRTADLRKRLARLLAPQNENSKRLNLRDVARTVRFQPTGSKFESDWRLYQIARSHRPEDYQRYLKLRRPPFLKVHLNNRFPRTFITTKLTATRALFYGPFRSRAAAERFENAFLEFFGIRRCEENLEPSADHPGCIYGEMNLCIRPCQAACSDDEYQREVGRLLRSLNTGGHSLVREIEEARDAASREMEFEAAAKQHERLTKVKDALRLSDELARDLDEFHGVVVQRSAEQSSVALTLLYKASFQSTRMLNLQSDADLPVSLDAKVRELLESIEWVEAKPAEKSEHLALLRRWHFSSFRRGEYVPIESMDRIPFRKLVNAISRVAAGRDR
jgi:excinuclease ABC subunit C